MRDIWAFLLQTLTASGVALLLLLIKAIFRDKLSPRWQFSVWVVLVAALLIPAGMFGSYILFDWPLMIEALKSIVAEDYTLTYIVTPIPLIPNHIPVTVWDWLFAAYLVGVVILAVRYIASYIKLRVALIAGTDVDSETAARIQKTEQKYHLKACKAVMVPGLHSAFVCGLLHPVLVLPKDTQTDEKVLLHELLHLKYRDVFWGILIGVFRCIHWCNPFLWYCANQAGNDLESLCDQRVLERLQGENRRDYGRILLSMANEKYARTPGTSSAANGGRNIRRRIEAITRFKKYPKGMSLVSCCIIAMLSFTLVGQQGREIDYPNLPRKEYQNIDAAMAIARLSWCTTPAGAIDTYAKAYLTQCSTYYAMCAPMSMQKELAVQLNTYGADHKIYTWDTTLTEALDVQKRYKIYNFREIEKDVYEAVLVVIPIQKETEDYQYFYQQTIRLQKEDYRWIVEPVTEWERTTYGKENLTFGCRALPQITYTGAANDFEVQVSYQKIFEIDNTIQTSNLELIGWNTSERFDTTPKPHAQFDLVYYMQYTFYTYTGNEAARNQIHQFGISIAPWADNENRPDLIASNRGTQSGSSSDLHSYDSVAEMPVGDGQKTFMGGSGSNDAFSEKAFYVPPRYAADLYVNGEKLAEITLILKEESA